VYASIIMSIKTCTSSTNINHLCIVFMLYNFCLYFQTIYQVLDFSGMQPRAEVGIVTAS